MNQLMTQLGEIWGKLKTGTGDFCSGLYKIMGVKPAWEDRASQTYYIIEKWFTQISYRKETIAKETESLRKEIISID